MWSNRVKTFMFGEIFFKQPTFIVSCNFVVYDLIDVSTVKIDIGVIAARPSLVMTLTLFDPVYSAATLKRLTH